MGTEAEIVKDIAAIGRISAVPRILETVAHISGLRFAAVARVTDSTWTACATYDKLDFGLEPGGQLMLDTTLCNDIRHSHQPIIFSHASQHPVYSQHHTPRIYGLESYVSVPIFRKDRSMFGTLCAIDSVPAKFDEPHVIRSLELFAELIGTYLETEERIEQAEAMLRQEQETAELRDQFIAVLGHDLRSPLQAIRMGTELLEMEAGSESARRNIARIQTSVDRIIGLVQDILDFARGRLGGGIPVSLYADEELAAELEHVVEEVRTATRRPDMHVQIQLDSPVLCDRKRMAQLLTNLLTNAVVHGKPGAAIEVIAADDASGFNLEVRNQGFISDAKKEKLFLPFSRSASEEPRPGLGLGLYIASEIAKAHGGELSVQSSVEDGTRFRFHLPKAAQRDVVA